MFKDLFSDRAFYRRMWALGFPIAMQNLMLALVAAADALMLGRVDQNSMAAVSLATQIQFIQNMILAAVIAVVGILGAQYWGKNDKSVVGDIFGISMRQCIVISLAFFIGCRYFALPLMHLFASDQALLDIGASYLRIASWSYLITGISQSFLAVMKVSEHATRSAWISSGTVIINIVLNAVFIFGLCGVPAYGADGAAIATVISRVIELVWSVASSYGKGYIRLRFASLVKWNRRLILDFWKCSLPLFGAYILWSIGFAAYTAVMGHLGPDAAAANSAAAVVRDLMCCLCNGICAAGGIIVGNELGAGKLELGKKYGDRLCILSYIIGLLSTLFVLATIPLVLSFVKLSDGARAYTIGMFTIMSFYMIGRCVNTIVVNGVFSAGGDTLFDMYSLIVSMWCLAVPIALLGTFYFHWPVLVVYSCTCLDEVGKIPWVMVHFRKYKWVRNLTRDQF